MTSAQDADARWLSWLRAVWVPLALVVILGAMAVVSGFLSPELQYVAETGFVYLVVVVGLYTFIGLSGVVSFGHITFMGIGAYASALVSIPVITKQVLLPALPHWLEHTQMSLVPSVLVGGVVALVFALIISFPIMRISGIAASITLFAVLIVGNVVGSNWVQVTRATQTMLGVPTDVGMGVAFGAAALAVCAAYGLEVSRVGLRLKATREDEFAARSVGISVARSRAWGFALSALIVGMGGALYGHLVGAFSASDFYLDTTFLTIVMLVVGGMRSLTGAVVGTIVITVLQQLLTYVEGGLNLGLFNIPALPGLSEAGLALVLLLILLFRPNGITSGLEVGFPVRRRRRPDTGADVEVGEHERDAHVVQDLAHDPSK